MESTENSPKSGMAKKPADCFAAPEKAKCPVAPGPAKPGEKTGTSGETGFSRRAEKHV